MAEGQLPEYLELVAERAADRAIEKHIGLCEVRKIVLANGDRPGMDVRVDRLEGAAKRAANPWWRGVIISILTTVLSAAVLALLGWLLWLNRLFPGP